MKIDLLNEKLTSNTTNNIIGPGGVPTTKKDNYLPKPPNKAHNQISLYKFACRSIDGNIQMSAIPNPKPMPPINRKLLSRAGFAGMSTAE